MSSVLGLVGAVTGCVALLVSILAYRRDNPRLRVSADFGVSVQDGKGRVTWVRCYVENYGRAPAIVLGVGVDWYARRPSPFGRWIVEPAEVRLGELWVNHRWRGLWWMVERLRLLLPESGSAGMGAKAEDGVTDVETVMGLGIVHAAGQVRLWSDGGRLDGPGAQNFSGGVIRPVALDTRRRRVKGRWLQVGG